MPYSQQKVSQNSIHRLWKTGRRPHPNPLPLGEGIFHTPSERTRHHPFLNRQTTDIRVCLADGMMLRYRRHGLHRLGAARARTGCAQEAQGADEVEASQYQEGQLVGSVAVVHPSGEGRGD